MRTRITFFVLLLLPIAHANAQGMSPGEDKSVILAPYLWGTSIKGTSTIGTLPPLDIDASFGDIFSNLNFAASLHTEFRSNDWVFVVDPTFISLEVDPGITLPGPQGGTPKVEVDMWLVELWAGYRFDPKWEVIGGVRYQDQDIAATGLPFPANPGVNDSWSDWFLGFRFTTDFAQKWFVSWRYDWAFAGDSDLSWNTALFFNRRIGDTMALNLGYRALRDDYNNRPTYAWEVTQQGPVIGYTWKF